MIKKKNKKIINQTLAISQTDGNKGGNRDSRQDVPSHHMQHCISLQICLVTNAKSLDI